MPRIARALSDNCYCHIINRGNGRQQVFHKDGDYQAFLDLIQAAREHYPVRIYAWCLMPNHFHLLVQPDVADHLSIWMQWLMTSHVRRYHRHYGTSGHVWQGRYKSFLVQDNDHLLTVVRYIEANPVRAGLAQTAPGWQWSSHVVRENTSDGLKPDALPVALPADWTEYVTVPLTDYELEKIRNSVNRQSPFGKEEWQHEVCRENGLESTIRPLGRPKGRSGYAEK